MTDQQYEAIVAPSREEIAALRTEYGITSIGRGIKEFEQVDSFVRAVLKRWGSAPALEAPAAPVHQPLTNEQIEAAFKEGRAIFDRLCIARTDIGLRLECGRAVERAVLAAAPQAPAVPINSAPPGYRLQPISEYDAMCAAMAAPAAPAVDAPGLLLTVIQRLNQNPYSLTKSECIREVDAMREAAIAAQAAAKGYA